jgi:hypothetical protein
MMAQLEVRMPPETSRHRTPVYLGSVVTVSGAIAAGLVFALVSIRNQTVHPFAFGAASSSGVGLVAGFVSRLSLLHRSRAIRGLVSLVGACIGLIFLGWLSRGAYGMHLLRLHPEIPDWRGLVQLLLCSRCAPGIAGSRSDSVLSVRCVWGGHTSSVRCSHA